jgi:ubiquinone/menaquinone biosynthesis C-methylase UbiE
MRSIKTNTAYLLGDQYRNADNLDARARLHRQFSSNKQGWQRWLFDQLGFPSKARIIEFGCGPGWLWAENLDRIPPGWDVTLTDFSAGMVEESRHRLAGAAHAFNFEVVDIQAIPHPDAMFDGVIANHMLYHVPDLQAAIGGMRRILKPSGRLITATNGADHLREMQDLQYRFDPVLNYWEGFSAARSFEFDNGAELLSEFFSYVELRRYEDSLLVTEAGPLVDYILSGPAKGTIAGERRAELHDFIQSEIEKTGVIRITKDTGLLISTFDPPLF